MTKNAIIIGLLASTGLAGCNSVDAHRNFVEQRSVAEGRLAQATTPMAAADTAPVKVRNGVYVGGKAIRNENGDPLPARFQTDKGVTLVSPSALGLREIAAEITDKTKIPVIVAMSPAPGSEQGGAPAAAPPTLAAGPIPEGFPLNEALSAISGGGGGGGAAVGGGPITATTQTVSAEAIPLHYSGKLSGLLDVVAAHFNVAWRYEGGRIVIDTVVTRSFDVAALAVLSTQSFNLSSTGETSGDGSTTSAGQSANTSSTSDVYKEITAGLQSVIGGSGAFSVNTAAGVVTVTASPAAASRAGEYLKGINERMSKQVALQVNVYSVRLNDSEAFDLNVAGIFRDGTTGLNVGALAASGGVVPPVAGAAGAGLGWALLDGSSRFSGSQAIVNALSQRGEVAVKTTGSVTTLSGVPVPFQVGELRDYISEIERETDSEGRVTVSTTPGTVNTGFNMQLTPRVDANGDTLLQYGINITELTGENDGFVEVELEGGSVVQQRRMTQRNFIQQARIPNRGTLVLAGFEQVRSENAKSGVGHPNFPLLGGGRSSRNQREILVIVITPTLLDAGRAN